VSTWTRRAVITAGALSALTVCSDERSAAPRSPHGHLPTAPSHNVPATSTDSAKVDWVALERNVEGTIARPSQRRYECLRLLENPRHDGERPLAVLSVASPADVATGIKFAQDHHIPVAVRSGGHSYPGWSAGGSPKSLVIDCRPLSALEVHTDSARIGAGAALAQVYDVLGSRDRALAGGSCPTAGIAGLTLAEGSAS
jgi:FAD binding domain